MLESAQAAQLTVSFVCGWQGLWRRSSAVGFYAMCPGATQTRCFSTGRERVLSLKGACPCGHLVRELKGSWKLTWQCLTTRIVSILTGEEMCIVVVEENRDGQREQRDGGKFVGSDGGLVSVVQTFGLAIGTADASDSSYWFSLLNGIHTRYLGQQWCAGWLPKYLVSRLTSLVSWSPNACPCRWRGPWHCASHRVLSRTGWCVPCMEETHERGFMLVSIVLKNRQTARLEAINVVVDVLNDMLGVTQSEPDVDIAGGGQHVHFHHRHGQRGLSVKAFAEELMVLVHAAKGSREQGACCCGRQFVTGVSVIINVTLGRDGSRKKKNHHGLDLMNMLSFVGDDAACRQVAWRFMELLSSYVSWRREISRSIPMTDRREQSHSPKVSIFCIPFILFFVLISWITCSRFRHGLCNLRFVFLSTPSNKMSPPSYKRNVITVTCCAAFAWLFNEETAWYHWVIHFRIALCGILHSRTWSSMVVFWTLLPLSTAQGFLVYDFLRVWVVLLRLSGKYGSEEGQLQLQE